MKRKKQDYKKIQLGFKTRKEYEEFHKTAVRFYGDYRLADCSYLRDCITQNASRRNRAIKEKAKAWVETTQRMNDLLLSTNDPYLQDEITEILKKQVKLWGF